MIFLTALWSKFYGYIVAVGASLALVAGIYLKGKSDQRASASAAENKVRLENIKKAKEIGNDVSKMDDASLDAELNKWMRD